MTLDEARAEIEARFTPHVMVGNYAHCATGEPYVEILSSGVREEGGFIKMFDTADAAVRGWLDGIKRYAKDKTGMLYWRAPPVLEMWDGKWHVYSRLVISDKPPIQLQCTIRGSL